MSSSLYPISVSVFASLVLFLSLYLFGHMVCSCIHTCPLSHVRYLFQPPESVFLSREKNHNLDLLRSSGFWKFLFCRTYFVGFVGHTISSCILLFSFVLFSLFDVRCPTSNIKCPQSHVGANLWDKSLVRSNFKAWFPLLQPPGRGWGAPAESRHRTSNPHFQVATFPGEVSSDVCRKQVNRSFCERVEYWPFTFLLQSGTYWL